MCRAKGAASVAIQSKGSPGSWAVSLPRRKATASWNSWSLSWERIAPTSSWRSGVCSGGSIICTFWRKSGISSPVRPGSRANVVCSRSTRTQSACRTTTQARMTGCQWMGCSSSILA